MFRKLNLKEQSSHECDSPGYGSADMDEGDRNDGG